MSSAAWNSGRPSNVLVVDDEESICCLLHELFAERGYHTELAMTGEDALHKAQHIPFDVVVTDVCLPGMSGLDLVRALRGKIPASSIILITGFLTLDLSLEAIHEGVADLIAKPIVSLDAILRSVEQVLQHGHATDAGRRQPTDGETETLLALCASLAHRLSSASPAVFLDECAEHVGRVLRARRVEIDVGVQGEDLPRKVCWPAATAAETPRAPRRDTLTHPLTLGERTLGILRAISPERTPSHRDLDFVATIGHLTALCLERAELREDRDASFVRFLEYLVQMRESLAGFQEGHCRRVADLAERLGRSLGFTQRGLNQLRRAALFHDLGKLGVNPELLNRPGPLSPAELEAVRRYREITERLLSATSCLEDVRHILLHLGAGEHPPEPSPGRAAVVPLESRVLTAAEAYVAMTSRRPHRPALSVQQALQEMNNASPSRYDADVIQALERVLRGPSPESAPESPPASPEADGVAQRASALLDDTGRTIV